MNKQLFLLHEQKLIYVRILKCASISVLREILPIVEPRLRQATLSAEIIDALSFYFLKRKVTKGYKSFAIVRNPFNRIVSAYIDLFNSESIHFTYANYWFGILARGMTFKQFINVIYEIPTSLLGPHFAPQTKILEQVGIREMMVFRLEKDASLIIDFFKEYGLTLHHQNVASKQYNLKNYYDLETLRKVHHLYYKDVITFNYNSVYENLKLELESVSQEMI